MKLSLDTLIALARRDADLFNAPQVVTWGGINGYKCVVLPVKGGK